MKWYFLIIIAVALSSFTDWGTDLEKAKQQAQKENKLILLNFSGSDWCGPCIRMKKEIFSSAGFQDYSGQRLVLLNADFPRAKKNQLAKDQQENNDRLAEVYNAKGVFPFTVLLNAEGKVLRSWEGFPDKGADIFVAQLKEFEPKK